MNTRMKRKRSDHFQTFSARFHVDKKEQSLVQSLKSLRNLLCLMLQRITLTTTREVITRLYSQSLKLSLLKPAQSKPISQIKTHNEARFELAASKDSQHQHQNERLIVIPTFEFLRTRHSEARSKAQDSSHL